MATNASLKALRDQLVLSYAENVIDSNEFILLYDANMFKDIYPYWKYSHFDMRTFDGEQCIVDFRFSKTHLYTLLDVLNVPDRVVTVHATVSEDIEALCILLKRLSFPCRYTDMTPMFGRNLTELCLIYNTTINLIYEKNNHILSNWNQPMLAPQQLQLYADAIHDNGTPLDSYFGFVDGTVYQIARPKNNLQQVYNGHKRVCGLKFQNIALPNGMIGNLAGPYKGRRHDSFMLAESGLLSQLQQHAWFGNRPLRHTLLAFIYKHHSFTKP